MLVLLVAVRPPIARGPGRWLDLALAASLAWVAFQAVPVPPSIRLALSPQVGAIDQRLWVDAPANPLTAAPRPLSLDVDATLWALAIAVAAVAAFWSAREIFRRGGSRLVSRGIAWTGLIVAIVALLQHYTAPAMLYWRWPTLFKAAFTPYVNKNYFAAWMIMAIPVTVGYLLARIHSRRHRADAGFDAAADPRSVWLAVSACVMSTALLATLSRSGLTGAAAAVACFMWLAHGRVGRRGLAPLAAGVAAALVVAAMYANIGALADRVTETLQASGNGRTLIWRETWPMVKDFWLTGVGAGAYERGMLVYWQHKGLWYVNHAHNEYLQFAAEGGVVLCALIAIAIAAGIRRLATVLRHDTSSVFWLRAGAASGLLAIAVQSIWDTGLRMPANTILFAITAAIALHDPE